MDAILQTIIVFIRTRIKKNTYIQTPIMLDKFLKHITTQESMDDNNVIPSWIQCLPMEM